MPLDIIDRLQMVNVEVRDDESLPVTVRLIHSLAQLIATRVPYQRVGQVVAVGVPEVVRGPAADPTPLLDGRRLRLRGRPPRVCDPPPLVARHQRQWTRRRAPRQPRPELTRLRPATPLLDGRPPRLRCPPPRVCDPPPPVVRHQRPRTRRRAPRQPRPEPTLPRHVPPPHGPNRPLPTYHQQPARHDLWRESRHPRKAVLFGAGTHPLVNRHADPRRHGTGRRSLTKNTRGAGEGIRTPDLLIYEGTER